VHITTNHWATIAPIAAMSVAPACQYINYLLHL